MRFKTKILVCSLAVAGVLAAVDAAQRDVSEMLAM